VADDSSGAASAELTPESARDARLEASEAAPEVPEHEDEPAVEVTETAADELPTKVAIAGTTEVDFDPVAHAKVMRVYVDPDDEAGAKGRATKLDIRVGGKTFLGVPVPESYTDREAHTLRDVPFDRPRVDPSSGEIREHFEIPHAVR